MSTAKPALTEKERRALALQKALRDNLRRRKAASSDDEAAQAKPDGTEADGPPDKAP